ncbi:MAG: UDP-N-acetylglucosamine 2-epimerase (non-hydrolyzing) [Bacillota bacterium]
MRPLKLMTIVGTRPEIIRLSCCIAAFDNYFDHVLVHTGQNWYYTLNGVFFEELSLRPPDHSLNCAGDTLGDTLGSILAASYRVLREESPDALLILGDTNSALCAIPAKRLKIPIFHMEAGNRCFDFNVPEEINRRIIDHVADVNLAYTEHARRYLLAEGIRKEHIFVTGSPMPEVLRRYETGIRESDVLERLRLAPNGYFLVSAHREENVDDEGNFLSLMRAMNAVAEQYGLPVVYSVHPRSMKRIGERGFTFHPLVRCLQPFGFPAYCHLQINARCVLSDSGTLSEESAILGFPAVLLRTSTERPEVLDKGSIVIGGITERDILQAIELAVSMTEGKHKPPIAADYQDTNVSEKVVRLIQSYTHIINDVTWGKRPPAQTD